MKYLEEYKKIHKSKKYGISSDRSATEIKKYIPIGIKSLLDYGAGQSNLATLLGRMCGISDIGIYDPAVAGRDVYPDRDYDFVTCTDVLEHIPEEELNEVITDIWSLQNKGAIFVIALVPADQKLPNGENAHCTVKSKEWWYNKLSGVFDSIEEIKDLSKSWKVAFLVHASS